MGADDAQPIRLRSGPGGGAVPLHSAEAPTPDAAHSAKPAAASVADRQAARLPGSLPAAADPNSFYAAVGGRATFERLVRGFYAGVAADPALLALYPEEDLEPAIQRLTGFLEQYWGGPTTYSEQRGHPRLRMRHMPFAVNPAQRDRWLTHMRDAVDALALPPLYEAELWGYLERAAHAMVNTFEE